jgi:hypothetical protein
VAAEVVGSEVEVGEEVEVEEEEEDIATLV